jgi:hypothetical protein
VLIVLVVSGLFDDFAVLFVLVVSKGLFVDLGDFLATRSASAAGGATAAAFRFLVTADDVRSAASESPPTTVEGQRVAVEGHRVASDGARPTQPLPGASDELRRINAGGAPPAAGGPLHSEGGARTAASPSSCAPSCSAPGCPIAPTAAVDPKSACQSGQPGICCPATPGWKIHPAITGIIGIPGLAGTCHPPYPCCWGRKLAGGPGIEGSEKEIEGRVGGQSSLRSDFGIICRSLRKMRLRRTWLMTPSSRTVPSAIYSSFAVGDPL